MMTLMLIFSALIAQAPTPAALKSATSVYLRNDGVRSIRLDQLAKQLRSWKRFTLVEDQAESDVIIILGQASSGPAAIVPVGGMYLSVDGSVFVLTVKDRLTGEQLWSDQAGDLKSLVKHLRERLEPKK